MLSAVNGPAERSAAYVMSVMIYSSLAGPERPGAWEAVLKVAIYFSLPSGPFSRVTAAAAGPAPARPGRPASLILASPFRLFQDLFF